MRLCVLWSWGRPKCSAEWQSGRWKPDMQPAICFDPSTAKIFLAYPTPRVSSLSTKHWQYRSHQERNHHAGKPTCPCICCTYSTINAASVNPVDQSNRDCQYCRCTSIRKGDHPESGSAQIEEAIQCYTNRQDYQGVDRGYVTGASHFIWSTPSTYRDRREINPTE